MSGYFFAYCGNMSGERKIISSSSYLHDFFILSAYDKSIVIKMVEVKDNVGIVDPAVAGLGVYIALYYG